MNNQEILEWYFSGFSDELKGSMNKESDEEINNIAYRTGAMHAKTGDDLSSIDYMTDSEILKIIKNEYERNN